MSTRVDRREPTDLPSALAPIAQLEQAVMSNRTIGLALGILMERHRVDADTALAELRRASNRLNTKLVTLAQTVIEDRSPPTGT